jgi:hypothetical protein
MRRLQGNASHFLALSFQPGDVARLKMQSLREASSVGNPMSAANRSILLCPKGMHSFAGQRRPAKIL